MKLTLMGAGGVHLPQTTAAFRPLMNRIMMITKLTSVLLLALMLQTSAKSFAQKVSLKMENALLTDAFAKLQIQTGRYFVYAENDVKDAPKISINVKDISLEDALNTLLAQTGLSFKFEKEFIVIKAGASVFKEITGIVSDQQGRGLSGVNVTLKGTKTGTVTDGSGGYNIQGSIGEVLVFSSVNYDAREVKIASSNRINIVMNLKITALDETIIMAYGTTTKRMNLGSISKISAEEISRQPVSNPLAALEGRVPGLVVTQTTGLPGGAFTIQIRGQNSLNPSPDGNRLNPVDNPLFVIDGVPIAAQNGKINQFFSLASPGTHSSYGNPNGGISPLNSFNPADIESIEILRDADATSIYGSRGANGVILITTKKGKSGKSTFSASVNTGISRVTHLMPMMNTQQYRQSRKEAFSNDGIALSDGIYDPGYAPDLRVYDSTKFTDWQDYFLGGQARATDANLTLSGGSGNTQFMIGSGYHQESYILPGDFADRRISFNANVHHVSTDQKLSVDLSANYSYDRNNSSGNQSAFTAFSLPPNFPDLMDSAGNLAWNYKGISFDQNPLAYLRQKYTTTSYNLVSNLSLNYELIQGLRIKASLGYNTLNNKEVSQAPKLAQNPEYGPVSLAYFGNNDYQAVIIEPQIEYSKTIADGKLTLLAGGTYQQNIQNAEQIYASNYADDALLGSIAGAGNVYAYDTYGQYRYNAFFARLNYVYNSQYIFNMAGRRDGSSRFGPGKQFGNFGSAGAGWIFSQQDRVKKHLPWLSFGKIKATYGTTGNDNIGNYLYLPSWSSSLTALGLNYRGVSGYVPANLYNPEFSWSVTKKLEAGIELGLFTDRIFASIVWYRNRSGNQLVAYNLPSQTGFTSVTENFPALVQNKGLEVALSSNIVKTSKLSWNASLTLTIPKNKLVSFPGIETSSYKYTYVTGQPLNVIRGFKYSGVNQTTGLYEYETKAGRSPVPLVNTDFQVLGTTDPKYYGGFKNTLTYKSFLLEIFLDFRKQLGVNYLQQLYSGFGAGTMNNIPAVMLDRWQSPGDNSTFQKFSSQYYGTPAAEAGNKIPLSSKAYSDASFIRFKNIYVSYDLNGQHKNGPKIFNCKIYLSAQNLFTITNYLGHDPENQSYFGLPPLKTIVCGLQFTL